MDNPFDDDISVFAVVFTRAIIAWNNVERSAQSILKGLAGNSFGAIVAITHLGNVALKDALLAVADSRAAQVSPERDELADHIVHFVTGMDILRAYRNHYVHNLITIGKSPDDPAMFQGLLHVMEARGKLTWVQDDLPTAHVAILMQHALRLSAYGEALARHLRPGNALAPSLSPPPPLASLEKPIWPERLKKNRTHL